MSRDNSVEYHGWAGQTGAMRVTDGNLVWADQRHTQARSTGPYLVVPPCWGQSDWSG